MFTYSCICIRPFAAQANVANSVNGKTPWRIVGGTLPRRELHFSFFRYFASLFPHKYTFSAELSSPLRSIAFTAMVQGKSGGKTPYQGSKKTFGEFNCPECKRSWMSGHSWANTGQDCLDCDIKVYPFRQVSFAASSTSHSNVCYHLVFQRPLQKGKSIDKSNPRKPHLTESCEKCVELGQSCVKLSRHTRKR